MKFMPYQKKWINDESSLKLYEKSRRIGITYATSYRAVRKCLLSGDKNSDFVQWVSSRDEITAKEFITDYVAFWAREANKAARKVAEAWDGIVGLDGQTIEVVDEKKGITARVVKFKNGARIYSLSSNPLAFAGKGGDVLIDEWDLHDDQKSIYDMAHPCITWGGQLELVSAYDPNGSEDSEFAIYCRACKNGDKPNISFHSTTLIDAIDDGFVETVNEVKKSKGRPTQTRDEFLQSIKAGCRTIGAFNSQYMCMPNNASGQQIISSRDLELSKSDYQILRKHFVGTGDILDVIDKSVESYFSVDFWREFFQGFSNLALGWDIAVSGDLASIFVNDESELKKRLIVCFTFKKCKIETQRRVVEAMFYATYNIIGCGDKSGIGYSDVLSVEQKFYERFRGVMFNGKSKIEAITCMQSVFESNLQILPKKDIDIIADFKTIKNGSSPNGRLIYLHDKNEHLSDSHSDIAISCSLAHYASDTLSYAISRFESLYDSDNNDKYNNYYSPDHSDDT